MINILTRFSKKTDGHKYKLKKNNPKKDILGLKKELREKDKEIKRLTKLTYHDNLTGLLNRDGFQAETNKFIQTIKKEISLSTKKLKRKLFINNLSIVFIDLDKFKGVNDNYGHEVGDKVLYKFACILQGVVRDIDVVCRWSGDEFVVALIGSNNKQSERKMIKLQKEVEKDFTSLVGFGFAASFGIASVYDENRRPNLEFNLDKLIKEADKAMYKQKKVNKLKKS